MSVRVPLLLMLLLALQGCAQIPFIMEPEKGIGMSNQQILREADRLVGKGAWQEAITLLKKAQINYPESKILREREQDLVRQWQDIQQTVQHKILVIEVTALKQRLQLLEVLRTGDPGNYGMKTRYHFWKEVQRQKLADLIQCGEYQQGRSSDLAQHCLKLAAEIGPTPELEQRLAELLRLEAEITESLRLQGKSIAAPVTKSTKKPSAEAQLEKTQENKAKRLLEVEGFLTAARSALTHGDYQQVVSQLREAIAIQPESSEYWADIEAVQWKVDEQIGKLIRQGEVYYGYDQLEEAVSTWEKVLLLDPERWDIAERINRARKVLLKLESIKKMQGAES